MRLHAQLIFVFFSIDEVSLYVGQAGLKLLTSGDPPASASQSVVGIKNRGGGATVSFWVVWEGLSEEVTCRLSPEG